MPKAKDGAVGTLRLSKQARIDLDEKKVVEDDTGLEANYKNSYVMSLRMRKDEEGPLLDRHPSAVHRGRPTVTIINKKDVFPLVVRLVTKAGLDIMELLMKKGFARGRASVIT